MPLSPFKRYPTKTKPLRRFSGTGVFVWYGPAVKRIASSTSVMGIFLLTDFHGFAKSFFTLIARGSPPTLSISAWDNVVRPMVIVQRGHYILKALVMSYRYSYSIPIRAYFRPAMYNVSFPYNVSFGNFLLLAARHVTPAYLRLFLH